MAHGDLALRRPRDIDLLVHPDDLEKSMILLQKDLGFHRDGPYPDLPVRLMFRTDKHVQFMDEHQSLLELHWRLDASHGRADEAAIAGLLQRRVTMTLGGCEIPVLHPADRLTYLCFHGARHQWLRLYWLSDIWAWTLSFPDSDWNAVIVRAREQNQARPLALGFALTELVIGLTPPKPIAALIDADPMVIPMRDHLWHKIFPTSTRPDHYPIHTGGAEALRWSLDLVPSRAAKTVLAARYLLTPKTPDIDTFRLPPACYPLYYLLRPMRLLAGLFRRSQ